MVSGIIKKSFNALVSKQTNIFSAALFIVITTVLSQILGFVKYRMLVSIFGASSDLGVFFAAFRIPDFLFQILVASALSSVFIPIFSDYINKDNKKDAYNFTSSLITIGVTIFVLTSLFVALFAYQFSSMITPGFSHEELVLMANLMRIILIAQVFFVIGTFITAVLQSFQHFLIPGIASSFYNLGIIIGILLFASIFGIYGASIGALLGSILFCIVQIPLLIQVGFSFTPLFKFHEGVIKVFNLMIPRSLALLVTQIAITANVFFASFISARSLVIFDLAQTLIFAPVVLFGQSIAQASFPTLSLKKENKQEFLYVFLSSFTQILYLTLPVSAILIVLRIPVVRLLYGASRFDWKATVETGMTLSFFAISIFAQALILLLSRAFFALKDTKTPFYITVLAVGLNIIMGFVFILVYKLSIPYLALAFSFANIFAIILLMVQFNKKIPVPKSTIIVDVVKISIATLVMGLALYIPIKLLDRLVFDTTRTINLIALTGIASVFGFVSYIFFTWLLNIKEALYIIEVFKKFSGWKRTLQQVEELIEEPTKLNP